MAPNQKLSIFDLPPEIIKDEIFSKYLEFNEVICTCSLVCKHFYELSVNSKLDLRIPRFNDDHQSLAKCCQSERLKYARGFESYSHDAFMVFAKYLNHSNTTGDDLCYDGLKSLTLIALDECTEIVSHCRSLERLSLVATLCEIGDWIGNLSRLTFLDLSSTFLSSESCKYIQKCESLIQLNLSDNETIGNEACLHLSKLKNLTILKLENCAVKEKGVEYISKIATLKQLNLSKNRIDDKGFLSICKLTNLTSLKANSCSIESIKEISNLDQLTELDLGQNCIDTEGVKIISELTRLKILTLSSNQFNPESVEYLSKLSALEDLDLRDNDLTFEDINRHFNPTKHPKLGRVQIISRHIRQYYNF